MLQITKTLQIPEQELSFRFIQSSGPGGQNVNKVATKVELRFALADSQVLRADVKRRLKERYPSYVTDGGELVVRSDRHRTQPRNRADALERLAEMIRGALVPPKPRRKTQVSRRQKAKRVESKRRRSEVKRNRGPVGDG